MPGKYSHSVVLADYSSRGIINLPNDQHIAYLRASPYPASQRSRQNSNPWSDKSPTPQSWSKSGFSFTNQFNTGIGRVASPSRYVIIDEDLERSRQQRPSTSHNSHPTPNRSKQFDGNEIKDSFHLKTTTTPTPDIPIKSVKLIPDPKPGTTSPIGQSDRRIRANDFLREKSAPPPKTRTLISSPTQPTVPPKRVSEPTTAKVGSTPKITSDSSPFPSAQVSTFQTKLQPAKLAQTARLLQRQSSQETQIYRPRSTLAEPDFEGFSDADEPSSSYFEQIPAARSVASQSSTTRVVQRSDRLETPSPHLDFRTSPESKAKTYRSISTEPSEVFTELGASPLRSHGKLDSLTSQSTTSSTGTQPASRTSRINDSKHAVGKSVAQDWKLPEIDEDGAFGPEFFAQGPHDQTFPSSPDASVDSFLNRPLGTVSAGRDIDFTKDRDEDSETDAACPPDIGRYRDEGTSRVSPYLQAKRSDGVLGSGAIASGPTPKSKKMGFFAKFRSKSTSRG